MTEKAKNPGKAKLSTEPYKGVRDFYPEDMAVQEYIISTMREVSERFGYSAYDASILEPTELYASKTSEEIVGEQTYTFTDRGDRSVTLRPEMTPTVARMVAARRRELSFPLRWYSIPNVFRYERPQRGRLREHWQLNCDLFGVSGAPADAEIISLAYHMMRAFGALPEDFQIRVNDRQSILENIEALGISGDDVTAFLSLLDKRAKMTAEEFESELRTLVGDAKTETFLRNDADRTPSVALRSVVEMLFDLGITNIIYDPNVIRGFTYYTGIVFEVFDTSPENNRSLFGGGRYDNLLEMFGEEKVPVVGFGMGDVTIRDFLETRKLIPPYTSVVDLTLLVIEPESLHYASELAQNLRDQGLHISVDFTFRKLADQIKSASKASVPFVSVIGGTEESSRTLRIKDLVTGEETEMPEGAVAGFVFERVR